MLTAEAEVLAPTQLRMADLISALSFALDLTEGQPMGHAVKTCALSMRLAEVLKLPTEQKSDLYYAALMKDAGCSSNSARMYEILGGDERKAKQEVKATDWTRVTFESLEYLMRNVMPGRSRLERVFAFANVATNREAQTKELISIRCDRGAQIARKVGFSDETISGIYHLDEHWNGKGYPERRKGTEIPLFSRIMNLCQTLEVFSALNGVSDAFQVIRDRSGSWFDPELVTAAEELEKDKELWSVLETDHVRQEVLNLEPLNVSQFVDDRKLDDVCEAFADHHRHQIAVHARAFSRSYQRGRVSLPAHGPAGRSSRAGAPRGVAARHRQTQRAEQHSG